MSENGGARDDSGLIVDKVPPAGPDIIATDARPLDDRPCRSRKHAPWDTRIDSARVRIFLLIVFGVTIGALVAERPLGTYRKNQKLVC